MPKPSPFHDSTLPLCTSLRFKEWGGYHAVCSFDTCHEREYYAFRHGAGMIDVSPLFKYAVKGKDAAAFLSQIMVRDVTRMKDGQVTYTCWCDDRGKVLDDGTIMQFNDQDFRVTAAEPSFYWFSQFTRGYDVTITDESENIAALSVQGPKSRELLNDLFATDLSALKFFRMSTAKLGDIEVLVSRTGYTGDLGYELWVEPQQANKLYGAIMETGKKYGLLPCGLDALDMTRIEAGFIMNGVDYFSANHCPIEARKSTPYELGLGWMVHLDREPFNGQSFLKKEKNSGSAWKFIGLDIDWVALEKMFMEHGLPPGVSAAACREPKPIYDDNDTQIGFVTSSCFSPILKKYVALAHMKADADVTDKIKMEATVEYHRRKVSADIVKTPFFNPERKRS